QTIVLVDQGSGQISWQATATESWLMVSPRSGTFSYDQPMQVTIVGDRSKLSVGSYSASVIFRSNAGRITLLVKMFVDPPQPAFGVSRLQFAVHLLLYGLYA